MTAIRITRDQATEAIRANVGEDGKIRYLVDHGGELAVRSKELDDAVDDLRYYDLFAFQQGPFAFNLAALGKSSGAVLRFDVPYPAALSAAAYDILTKHSGILSDVLKYSDPADPGDAKLVDEASRAIVDWSRANRLAGGAA